MMDRDVKSDNAYRRMRATLNPYATGAALILKRLQWDMNPSAWRSRKQLNAIKNKYTGKKAVILCNGPSLNRVDFSLLSDVYTFGLNKINLLFDRSNFRPNAIVAVNPFVIEQNKAFYSQTNINLFLDSCAHKVIHHRQNIIFLHSVGYFKFARDCSVSVFQSATVTFVALQLAFHMGFSDVALVGCDHNFAVKGTPNKTVTSGDKDDSHFDSRYFSGGQKWQLPDLVMSEAGYSLAQSVFNSWGRRLVNSTDGGQLEILKRVNLKDFLSSSWSGE